MLRLLILFAIFAFGASCASSWREEPAPEPHPFADLEYPDQQVLSEEEVLDGEEDEFGRPVRGPSGQAGEFLVAVGYIATIVAGIVLPLLVL